MCISPGLSLFLYESFSLISHGVLHAVTDTGKNKNPGNKNPGPIFVSRILVTLLNMHVSS